MSSPFSFSAPIAAPTYRLPENPRPDVTLNYTCHGVGNTSLIERMRGKHIRLSIETLANVMLTEWERGLSAAQFGQITGGQKKQLKETYVMNPHALEAHVSNVLRKCGIDTKGGKHV